MVQAEVTKSGSETTLSTIRKFSRKVQGAGVVKTARKRRYYTRPASKSVSKKRALKLIERREKYTRLVKEGKIAEPTRTHSPRESGQGTRYGGGLAETPIAR